MVHMNIRLKDNKFNGLNINRIEICITGNIIFIVFCVYIINSSKIRYINQLSRVLMYLK